jgi:hypothetical protein
LELRDRRNPEVIISRETLVRSVDYNLDSLTGRLFFLRYVSTFDRVLNLMQVVVTYEHRASSMSSAVYTARARKNFKKIGLKLGFSAALQRESTEPDFFLGGVDVEKSLPRGGSLQMAWATSQGEILGSGNLIETNELKHDGTAYQLTLTQPLPFFGSTVRARYQNASEGFFNPFGGTVTPGSRRGEVSVEMKPGKKSVLRFGVTTERNQTENVDNGRLTLSAAMDQTIQERVRLHFGFDHRSLTDDLNDKQTDSNLVTIGAEIQATDKLQFSVKREQNLGDADPTYPTQTTLGATYQVNTLTKLFFTQRLAAAPIVPIADFTANGFAGTQSRRETAIGIETRFGKYTAMTGAINWRTASTVLTVLQSSVCRTGCRLIRNCRSISDSSAASISPDPTKASTARRLALAGSRTQTSAPRRAMNIVTAVGSDNYSRWARPASCGKASRRFHGFSFRVARSQADRNVTDRRHGRRWQFARSLRIASGTAVQLHPSFADPGDKRITPTRDRSDSLRPTAIIS